MVDFNDVKMVGTPAIDVVRILLLEKRENVARYIEYMDSQNSITSIMMRTLRARLRLLFSEMAPMLVRRKVYDENKKLLEDDNVSYTELCRLFNTLNFVLDEIQLTRLDVRTVIDTRRVKNSNDRF